jgi:DNA-binding CsgD family transcriptional regulator
VRDLVEAASRMAGLADRDRALDLLMAAGSRCYWGGLQAEGREVVRAAGALGATGDQRLLYIQAFAVPVARAATVLREFERTVPPGDPVALCLRGMAVCAVGSFDRALPLLSASVRWLREQGRTHLLAQVLPLQAWAALESGDFGVAVPAAEEASRLPGEAAQPVWKLGGWVARAALAALRGDRPFVERLTAGVEQQALPIGATALLSLVQCARGRLQLGEGRHVAAYEELRRIFDSGDPAGHGLTRCFAIGDFVEAAVHSGHRDEAVARLAEIELAVGGAPASWVHAQLLYGRVQIAATADDENKAERDFEAALGEDLQAWPLIRARLLLTQGEWLRRRRRLVESRAPLRSARDAFDTLGTGPWAERARRELRASGESSRRRARDSREELTPQELQIVEMAAQGLSNREIAERLYLSHRTIESHLYRVFPKLGVASRAELAGALDTRQSAPA